MLDDTVHAHQGEDGLVGMVCQEFASLCQTHGVDAMRLEGLDGEIGTYSHYHQRHEEGIATSQFRNEENTRERGVHDTAHQATHAQHGKVALWDVDSEDVVGVPYPTENETADTTEEKAGSEDTTTTASTISSCRGKDLENDNQEKIDKQVVATIEEGAVHRSIPISLSVTIEQKGDEVVSFAIKRREEIDEQAQHSRSNQEFLISPVQATEESFKEVHGTGEVQSNQSANNTQSEVGRNAIDCEGILQMELEDGIGARYGKCEPSCSNTRDKQGQETGHRKVYHQHLKHKDKSRNGGLEDTRHSTSSTTTNKQHHVFVTQSTELSQRTAYSTTCQHDRSLSSNTTTKTDGNSGGHNGGPCIVRLDAALLARNGEKNLGDTMPDVITDNIADEEHRQPNAHDRIDEVEPVGTRDGEFLRQQMLYPANEPLQQKSGTSGKDANEEADEQHEGVVGKMPTSPTNEEGYGISII